MAGHGVSAQVKGEGENERVALFPVSWGWAMKPDAFPFPGERAGADLTGSSSANPWGRASAGAARRLLKPWSCMLGEGPGLAQCKLSSVADQLDGSRTPRHCPSAPLLSCP